jgi:hypothetical protein
MHAWAEIVAVGGEVVAGKAEADAAVTAKIPAYDVELERQRLAFEMKKIRRRNGLAEADKRRKIGEGGG